MSSVPLGSHPGSILHKLGSRSWEKKNGWLGCSAAAASGWELDSELVGGKAATGWGAAEESCHQLCCLQGRTAALLLSKRFLLKS